MKVEKLKAGFEPILLTIETQDELDRLFALCNHSLISDRLMLYNMQDLLHPHRSDNYVKYHNELEKLMGFNK